MHSYIFYYKHYEFYFSRYSSIKILHGSRSRHIIKQKSEYDVNNRINNLHVLGKHIQDQLHGRFVKEQTKDPNISRESHVIKWFEKNCGLNFESDRLIVQAGFLCMFLL